MNICPANEQIDRIFANHAAPGSPGCAIAVMKDGAIVYQKGYGLANLEHTVPNSPETVFNIGSMSKQFTAFAIALLEADGKISFEDDIRQYLPDIHDFGAVVTIRHLIHHTSGIRCTFPELLVLAEWRDTDSTTTQDVLWLLKKQLRLNFPPGEEYSYANSNYILLAKICEQVSGQSFSAFCQERIFAPLGMNRTVVNDSIYKVIPGRALGYYHEGPTEWFYAALTDAVVGPTNIYTTVQDMAKWDENFYTGKIGGMSVIKQMETPGRLNDGTELEYAFGLVTGDRHLYRGWKLVEHGGGQGGYGSWMMRFPEKHLSVVVLFNSFIFDMQDYAFKLADLYLEEKQRPEAQIFVEQKIPVESIKVSAEMLKQRMGVYFNAQRAAYRRVSFTDDHLQFQEINLVPVSDNQFFLDEDPNIRIEFIFTVDGLLKGLKVNKPQEEVFYEYFQTVTPTPNELLQYEGRYYSPELDIYWTFVVHENHLIAKRRKYVDSQLTPLFLDAFADDWSALMGYPSTYTILFERNEEGRVSGLNVSNSRVRHIHFVRQNGILI